MKYCWITPIIVAALALLFASALHIVGLKGKMSLHAPGEEKEAEADKFHSRSCLCLPSEIFICWWVSSWNSLHPLVVPAENACLVPPSSGLNANHFSTHLNKSWISLQPSLTMIPIWKVCCHCAVAARMTRNIFPKSGCLGNSVCKV